MKSRETLIRLKKFQVDEKRRRVNQIEGMIADFQRMSNDLDREILVAKAISQLLSRAEATRFALDQELVDLEPAACIPRVLDQSPRRHRPAPIAGVLLPNVLL